MGEWMDGWRWVGCALNVRMYMGVVDGILCSGARVKLSFRHGGRSCEDRLSFAELPKTRKKLAVLGENIEIDKTYFYIFNGF